ncbi:MAG TPA: SBBP repeat-containing protein, partial [Terriglobia bacterium]|nr:SBBP repeat-containing protein [Terriglobia bacterium]
MREIVTAAAALTRRGLSVILLLLLAAPAVRQLKATQPQSPSPQHSASSSLDGVRGRVPLPSRQLVSGGLQALYAQLPLRFEPNQGQADPMVRFMARAPGYGLFLTDDGAVLTFRGASPKCIAPWVRMKWLGSAGAPRVAGVDKLASRSNYFIGDNPNLWRTGIPNYGRVAFSGIYPRIDLAYYGNPRQLEYALRVAPGGNPNRLRFSLIGPSGSLPLRLNARGSLIVEIPGGLRFLRPVAYQEVVRQGRLIRRTVSSHYVLKGKGRVGILVGPYDRSRVLVIDPVLSYSTYLGGSGADGATSVAVDGSGDAFVTGGATSVNFPTANPLQKSSAGSSDVFVAELNPAGTSLVYSTYVGGSGFDKGTGIAIDSSGNAYVTGYTSSPNFPTTSKAFQTSYQGNGKSEAFVMKLSASGASMIYATYLGGTGGDFGQGIAVDSAGDAYVTGSTQSADFPVAKPLQAAIGGGSDAFVTELSPDGSSLLYSTFLGGSGSDSGQAIAVDSAGEAYVAGFTFSTDFPVQSPLQSSSGGSSDAFIAKLNASGSALVYSTYLGGNGEDKGLGIAVDASGEAYVTGSTQSINFPVSSGAYQTTLGGSTNAFVAKLSANGAQLSYATFLGGAQNDQGNGIALDTSGNAYVIGSTTSANFPMLNPSQSTLGGGACSSTCSNAFVSVLNPQGNGLVYSTYLGGSGPDYGQGIAVDAAGNAYVTGVAGSSNFPVVSGAFQGVYGSIGTSGNAFLAKISPNNAPSVSLNPQTINFGNEGMNATSPPQTVILTDAGSAPLTISSITTTGDFAQTNTCGGSLSAGGGQCTISVTFTPAAVAAETGDVVITDNAAGSPHQVSLSGTGTTPAAAVTFSPSSLTFGSQLVGTTSSPEVVTLSNTGSATLNVTKLNVSGAFAQTNNCPATLAPSANCVISITFSPTGTGSSNSGSLTITDGLTGTQPSVTITGTAEADFALSASGPSGTPVIGTNSL